MTKPSNIFSFLPGVSAEEIADTILCAADVRIERILSRGHASPEGFWYDQDEHEFVVLLTGAARLRFEDRVLEMTPGSCVEIPAHRRHRVEWTAAQEPTIWLAIHYR